MFKGPLAHYWFIKWFMIVSLVTQKNMPFNKKNVQSNCL